MLLVANLFQSKENPIRINRPAENVGRRSGTASRRLWTLVGSALLIALLPAAGAQDSASAQEHFQRGTELFQLHQLDKAEKEFLECLRIAPNSPQVYNNLGTIYFMENRLQAAVSAFVRAYRLQPHDPEI